MIASPTLRTALAAILLTLAVGAFAQAAPTPPGAPPAPAPASSVPLLEAVTVTGVQPGPGLWKATRGDRTLLILGTLSPIPQNITWKTDEIEDAIAHSGALVLPPHVEIKPNVGFFGRLALLPSLIGVRNLPDGATLQETVPADVYQRWLAVKARYIGDDRKVERYRPIFAAIELYKDAIKRTGLRKSGAITQSVKDLATRHQVKQVPVEYTLLVDDPRAAVKEFKRSTLDDVSCFTQSVDNIDSQLADMTARGNAWATGDIASLLDEKWSRQRLSCLEAATDSGVAQKIGLNDVPGQVRQRWMATVEQTLKDTPQAVALVPLDDLLGPQGYLAALKAQGYTVAEPGE